MSDPAVRQGLLLLCAICCPPWIVGVLIGFIIERRRQAYGWRGAFIPRSLVKYLEVIFER